MTQPPLIVPIHFVLDTRAKWRRDDLKHFWSHLWPQAVENFGWCGIRLPSSYDAGDIWPPPGREPVITGLDSGGINLFLTDHIPLEWDQGRGLAGVTTLYRGYHLCMVALNHAHGHQIPILATNTCVHELLHALLHDIFEHRPGGLPGAAREFRVDYYATRLWLLHDGAQIRRAANSYIEFFRSSGR